ncbi:MAG: G5 domain-containing protein [Oscillospiraceae bacterium]|nr:G5 domain-containing protein [Oscillospiraceae bacterium]
MPSDKPLASKRSLRHIRILGLLTCLVFVLLLAQPAFAKNTYVITDGDRVFTYTTSATDPRQILGEAGLELDENDTYTTQPGTGGQEITVRRSQTIHINYYGEEMTVSSYGETVADLLDRLNLSLSENDTVSWPLSNETYDGMSLRVENIIHQEQTYTETIPHNTTYYQDPSLPEGMEVVMAEGSDGELLCTATVTYVNGREMRRTVLTETLTRNPVEEVIALGSGLAASAPTDADMPIITDNMIILPTGEVLTYVGCTDGRATAYYNQGTTATGTVAQEGVVAVDPSFIPHGTRMFIITKDGEYVYGIAAAEDAGDGNIIGNRIDLWFPTKEECIQFGYRDCTIYFLGSN